MVSVTATPAVMSHDHSQIPRDLGLAVLEASLQTRIRSQAVLQPAATGRLTNRHTTGPASSGLGEGLAGQDVLVPSLSSDPLVQGWAHAQGFWSPVVGVSSNTLVWLI